MVQRMKLKGVLTHSDVEGGHWLLKTDSGDEYHLVGTMRFDNVKDGQRVEVEGNVDKQAMGFGMMGPHFNVSKLTAL